MAKLRDTKSDSYIRLDERPELAKLCTQCPYPDCIAPHNGCAAFRNARKALSEGKPMPEPKWPDNAEAQHAPAEANPAEQVDPQALLDQAWQKLGLTPRPAIETVPAPVVHQQLHHLNEAIRHLGCYVEKVEEGDDGVMIDPLCHVSLPNIVSKLKALRRERFDHLVDWSAVAGGKQ